MQSRFARDLLAWSPNGSLLRKNSSTLKGVLLEMIAGWARKPQQ
jgi:hypothetical protein